MNIIAEMAGADSLVSIVKHLENNPTDNIIPTVVISPNEKIDNLFLELHNYGLFIDWVRSKGYNIENVKYIQGDSNLWDLLMSVEFPTPCIACHLYCHLMRLSYLEKYNAKLLTGERISHEGKVKLNQSREVLDFYENIIGPYLRPLEDLDNIDNILTDLPFDSKDKTNFLACTISKKPVEGIQDYLQKLYNILLV